MRSPDQTQFNDSSKQQHAQFGASLVSFTTALAKKGPIPAAGAAAAAALAQGAALGLLAVRVAAGKRNTGSREVMNAAARRLETVMLEAIASIDADANAVRQYMTDSKTARAANQTRREADSKVRHLNVVPIELLNLGARALRALDGMSPHIPHTVIAELGASAALLRAASASAALIIRANTLSLENDSYRRTALQQQQDIEAEVERLFAAVWLAANKKEQADAG